MSADTHEIDLSLVSHTNAGKTTLARTLLGVSVGEVRDEAHVTALAEPHTMIETSQGDVLRLWDTPGFGDSARLATRLGRSDTAMGWFLSEMWDRFRDRPFFSSQQAMKNVRDTADVVLYLVNASEAPTDAGYLAPEMKILGWLGRPVLVLLNQVGEPKPHDEEVEEEERWRGHLERYDFVRGVLTLDAFARCWVQELVLLGAVGDALPPHKRTAFERLEAAWQRRRTEAFDASMRVLADQLTRAALDAEPFGDAEERAPLREIGRALGLGDRARAQAKERGMKLLAERLESEARASTDRLIELHGLEGRAADDVRSRLASEFAVREPANEGVAAVLGGLVSGALTGLGADLVTGGLTLGGGLVAGALIGAIGGAGAAKAYNTATGREGLTVGFSESFLDSLVAAALLRYLAVAHYGRGRGEWKESEYPAFWRDVAISTVKARRNALHAIWKKRTESSDALRRALERWLEEAGASLLASLYPNAHVV